jgi:hypothetical protein
VLHRFVCLHLVMVVDLNMVEFNALQIYLHDILWCSTVNIHKVHAERVGKENRGSC